MRLSEGKYIGSGLELSALRESEVIRYLGYRKQQPEPAVMELVHACMQEAAQKAQPRCIYRRYQLEWSEDGLCFAGMKVRSRNLSRNLRGCESVILFAATLGSEIDRLLGRYLKLQIAKAAVLQATAAEAIECFCDSWQRQIEELAKQEGLYVRPRFSPGYGDLSLTLQPDFLRALDTQKQIGLYLSEGGIMLPEKSVTAVMGLSREETRCVLQGCEACENTGCAFRRCE